MMKNPYWYHFTFFHNRKLAKFKNRRKGWKPHIDIIKKFRILVSTLPTVFPCKFVSVGQNVNVGPKKDFLFSKIIHMHTSVLWSLDLLYWTWMWKFNIFKWYTVFHQLNKRDCSSMALWLKVWIISIFRKEFLKGSIQAIQQRSANFLTMMD